MNWAGFVDAPTAAATARRVAERLADPRAMRSVVLAPGNVGLADGAHPWAPLSLADGFPATVLLFAEFDRQFPDEGWDRVAREHVLMVIASLEREGLSAPGLLTGAVGIAFAVWSGSRDGSRYARVLTRLDAAVERLGTQLLERAEALAGGAAAGAFDAVAGVAGVARYAAIRDGQLALAERALRYLSGLARNVRVGGRQVPGWYVPPDRQFNAHDAADFPMGDLKCGLAHGIPGPLAVLATAALAGIDVEGQREAMAAMAGWLRARCRPDRFGPLWPTRLPLGADEPAVPVSQRAAWCYGVPGIARSLQLARRALGDAARGALADAAMRGFFARGSSSWGLEAATVCHGLAGLLQVSLRVAAESGIPELEDAAGSLAAEVVARYDERAPFGYRDVERVGDRAAWLDKAGLLSGAAGVALALSSAAARIPPIWDRALLIS